MRRLNDTRNVNRLLINRNINLCCYDADRHVIAMKNLTRLIRDEKKMFKDAGRKPTKAINDVYDCYRIEGQESNRRSKFRKIARNTRKLKYQNFT